MMWYKRLFFAFLFNGCVVLCVGQTASPLAISSGQLSGQIGDFQISSTLGQLMTLTVTNGDYTLTLGFQQPTYEVYTFVNSLIYQDFPVQVFPNPVQEQLTIQAANISISFYKLYTLSGQLVMQQQVLEQQSIYDINTSALTKGVYMLEIQGTQVLQKTYIKIIKQ